MISVSRYLFDWKLQREINQLQNEALKSLSESLRLQGETIRLLSERLDNHDAPRSEDGKRDE